MKDSNLTINIDRKDKELFKHYCREAGIEMTDAIMILVKKTIKEKRLPIDLNLRD